MGEERIAAELRLKLGLTVAPRTVRRYMPHPPGTRGRQSAQSWISFLHNHASAVLACDFFLLVTAAFRRRYVFVLLDIATRRMVHWNVTTSPDGRMDDTAVSERSPVGRRLSVPRTRPRQHRLAGPGRGPSFDVAAGAGDARARADRPTPLRTIHWNRTRRCDAVRLHVVRGFRTHPTQFLHSF
jgi:hypothetical protein